MLTKFSFIFISLLICLCIITRICINITHVGDKKLIDIYIITMCSQTPDEHTHTHTQHWMKGGAIKTSCDQRGKCEISVGRNVVRQGFQLRGMLGHKVDGS